jgi:predicted peroxiredoxin
MKNLIYFVFLMLLVACSNQELKNNVNKEQEESIKDGVFIHITAGYENPHRVLMPLKMALNMSKDKNVLIYLDIEAPKLVVKNAQDLNYGDFENLKTYLKMLLDAGVGIYACPTCLKLAGYEEKDLIDGIKIAQKDRFFDFTKGRIITLDY